MAISALSIYVHELSIINSQEYIKAKANNSNCRLPLPCVIPRIYNNHYYILGYTHDLHL